MPLLDTMQAKPASGKLAARLNAYLVLPALLGLGFLARFVQADVRFLNPDEILHYFLSVQPSLLDTYRATLTTAHPPLLIILLHYWGAIGHSELWLRIPWVLAGIGFSWFMYGWLKLVADEAAALIGVMLFLFSPALILLSAEVRQYGILLLFSSMSLYFLERGIQRQSARDIVISALSLYLALLSHYSSLIFALTLGVYALVRLAGARARSAVLITWIVGQLGALYIVAFLFTHHVPLMRARHAPEAIAETYLHRSVYWPGEEHAITFVGRSNLRLFHYLFSQGAVGVLALLVFLFGVAILFRRNGQAIGRRPSDWQLGIFLIFPLVVNCTLALFQVYPYGGSRHDSYLSIFAFSGIAIALSRWRPQWHWRKIAVLGGILLVCNVFCAPIGEYIPIKDQSRSRMAAAMRFMQQLPSGSVIYTDDEGGTTLSYYLCHGKGVHFGQPLSPLLISTCGRFPLLVLGKWIFKADSFPQDLQAARQTDTWKHAAGIELFQAGWFMDKEPELHDELACDGCAVPENFGRNIFACRLSAGSPSTEIQPAQAAP